MKYSVKKTEEKWPYSTIKDYGELTIEEIEKMAVELIGDVFDDMSDVKNDMLYISKHNGDSWSCNGYCLDITKVFE